MIIVERIEALRKEMRLNQLDAYLITGTDPHLSEYTPESWKTREWISGFSGSYGKVLVTRSRVLLWTDTRYFLQAISEISTNGVELMKDRVLNSLSLEEWIGNFMEAGQTVAVDGNTISVGEAMRIRDQITAKGLHFKYTFDLVSKVWKNRPNLPMSIVSEHPIEFACRSRKEKIQSVREVLLEKQLHGSLITSLDDIAWLLNIRSNEIEYTPLVISHLFIDLKNCYLFITSDKLTESLKLKLENDGVTVLEYDEIHSFLQRIANKVIYIDPIRTNYSLYTVLLSKNEVILGVNITTRLKAQKSLEELKQIRNAHLKDGVAMVESIFWILHNVDKKIVDELSIGDKLRELRSQQSHFMGDSFHPIVGYGPHGAIVHYHATDESNLAVKKGNILLIDSGGQYLDGTTDITRTITLGKPSRQQKEDFTYCLKSHIALATAVFPVGTKGYSLDTITRKPLWDKCLNYGHGTGHGIGFYLSVHEGPLSIRAEYNDERIEVGQVISNEPGLYREGAYGIRIENVILCQKHSSGSFGEFLCFETLSFCPIDKDLILVELLNNLEINWLNNYHDTVYQKLSPLIKDTAIVNWLKIQCAPFLET